MRSHPTPDEPGDVPDATKPTDSNRRSITSQPHFQRLFNVGVLDTLRSQIFLHPIQVHQMWRREIVFSRLPGDSTARVRMLTVLRPTLARHEYGRTKSHFGEKHLVFV